MKLSLMYGACAEMHVRAGELDLAQEVMDTDNIARIWLH